MPIEAALLYKTISTDTHDIHGLVQVVFHRDMHEDPEDVQVRDGEVLTILLFDLMKQQGYTAEQLYPMLSYFNKELCDISKSFMHDKFRHIPMVALQTFDNRFAGIAGYGRGTPTKFYDMAEKRPVTEKLPSPLVSGLVVIPELILRARRCVSNLARSHSEAANSPEAQTAPPTVP